MAINIEKAKLALDTLQRDKQEQEERLQRVKEAQKLFDPKYGFMPISNK